jgi:hypothetical protein
VFTKMLRSVLPTLFTVALLLLLVPEQARAQFRGRPQPPSATSQGTLPSALLRQQPNGSARQNTPLSALPQNTMATACQQTNAVPTSVQLATGLTNPNSSPDGLLQLQTALQTALQQTTALLTALQQNGSPGQSALLAALQQEQTALQTALQQTNALLAALQQNGQLTPAQLQALRQQQSSLTGSLRSTQRRGQR